MLIGLIWIFFGGVFFLIPRTVLGILAILIGLFLIIEALSRIIRGVFPSKRSPQSVFLLLSGAIIGAIGIIAFIEPALFAGVLIYLIALWAIVVGLGELAAAITAREIQANRWLGAIKGGISLFFGILLVLNPLLTTEVLIQVLGIFAILHGMLDIVLGFMMRSGRHKAGKVEGQATG